MPVSILPCNCVVAPKCYDLAEAVGLDEEVSFLVLHSEQPFTLLDFGEIVLQLIAEMVVVLDLGVEAVVDLRCLLGVDVEIEL